MLRDLLPLRVWGITPSSAATTIIAISVICAPLALMAVKGFVTRSIEEGDDLSAVVELHSVCTNMLSYSTCFTCNYICIPDIIE